MLAACSLDEIRVVPASLSRRAVRRGHFRDDLFQSRPDRADQPITGFGRRYAARCSREQPQPQPGLQLRMVWLNADGDHVAIYRPAPQRAGE